MANTSGNGPIAPLPSNRPSLTRSMSTQPLSSPRNAGPFSPSASTFLPVSAPNKEAFPLARARRGTPAPLARTLSSQSLSSNSFGSASPTASSSLASSLTSVSSLSDATAIPPTVIPPKGAVLESFLGMLSNAHGLPSPKRRLTHARDDSFGASELEREQLRVMQEQIAQQRQRQPAGGDASASPADRKTIDKAFTSPPTINGKAARNGGAATAAMENEMMATPPPQVVSSRPGMKRQCTIPLDSQSSASSVHSIQNPNWTGGSSHLSTPGLTPSHPAQPSAVAASNDALLEGGAPGDLVLDDDRDENLNDSPASSEIVTPERPFRLGSSIVAAAIGGQMTKKNDIPGPVLMANIGSNGPQPNIFNAVQPAEVPMPFGANGQMTPSQMPMTIPGVGGVPMSASASQQFQFAHPGVVLTSPPSAGSVGTSIGSPVKMRGAERDGDVWPMELQVAFDAALRIVPRLGRRKILIQTADGSKPLGRNELIANYSYRKTGQMRSRKQVSSHIQVLKNVHKNNPEWMRLVGEPGPDENDNFSTEQALAFGAYLVNGTLHPIGNDPFPMPDLSPVVSPGKRAAQAAARMTIGAGEDDGVPPVFFSATSSAHHAALMGLSGIVPTVPGHSMPMPPFGHPIEPPQQHPPIATGLAAPAPFSAVPSPLTPDFLSAMSSVNNSPTVHTAASTPGLLGPALGLLRGGASMARQGSTASLNGRMGALEVRSHAGSQSPEADAAPSPPGPMIPSGPVNELPMAPTSFMMWASPAEQNQTDDDEDQEPFVFATLNENESRDNGSAILVEELDRDGHDANVRFPGVIEAVSSAKCPVVHAQIRARLPSSEDSCGAAAGDVRAEVGVLSESSFGGKALGVAMTLVVGGKVVLRYATDLPAPAPAGDKYLYTAQLPGVFIGGLLKGTADAGNLSPLIAHSRDEVMFVKAALQQATILAEYHVLDTNASQESPVDEEGPSGTLGEVVLIIAYEFDVAEEGQEGTMHLRHMTTRMRRASPPRKVSTASVGSAKRPSPPIPQIREPSPMPPQVAQTVEERKPFDFSGGLSGPPRVVRPSSTTPSKKRHASKNLSISIPERSFCSASLGVPSAQLSSGGANNLSPSSRAATPSPLTPAIQIVHTPTVAPGAPGPGDLSSIRRLEHSWAASAGMNGDLHSPAIANYHYEQQIPQPAPPAPAPDHQAMMFATYQHAEAAAARAANGVYSHATSAQELQETADFQAVLSEFGGNLGMQEPPPVPQVNVSAPFSFPGHYAPAPVPPMSAMSEQSAALSHMYALTAAAHTPTYNNFPMHLPNGPATPFMPVDPAQHQHQHHYPGAPQSVAPGSHLQVAQAPQHPPHFAFGQPSNFAFSHPMAVPMDYFGAV